MAKIRSVKKKKASKLTGKGTQLYGAVMLELSMWVFEADDDVLEFHAEQIKRAFMLNYGIRNFGVKAFGFEEE
jgi:hypothetical protein